MQSNAEYDVIVVGGGHAGIEASLASARLGCNTLLVTGKKSAIGQMPCNPAIGGQAKSHLVHELDALGGEMGRAADATGIQFKTLNFSRGPAVWATRVQCDKKRYAEYMQRVVFSQKKLAVLEDTVTGILCEHSAVAGIETQQSGKISAKTVVLTTGTALGGREYIGHDYIEGGGDGRPPANELSHSLKELGFDLIRLKTGTPPRLLRNSIDFTKTIEQPGNIPPPHFSLYTEMFHVEQRLKEQPGVFHVEQWPALPQCSCFLTHTNPTTHLIILDNLPVSALYGGDIVGTGVRYCPSIEDKIVKFKGVDAHHVMLEPEGCSDDDWIYPNGLSNSFPKEVQEKLVHSVAGLEKAVFAKYAYAIEYDAIDARELDHSFESKRISGLFFGGQVNGTTGYEEAAAQGFVAGVNAALKVQQRERMILGRNTAYIGVMVDDLVTKGTNEPYRMFTSRAERRLLLRQDNARYRLLAEADRLGILDRRIFDAVERDKAEIDDWTSFLDSTTHQGKTLASILSRKEMDIEKVCKLAGKEVPCSSVGSQLEILAKYRGYIELEEKEAARASKDEELKIPSWLDYSQIAALRYESREKLLKVRPVDIGQASRIPGVNPSDLAILAMIIRRGPGTFSKKS